MAPELRMRKPKAPAKSPMATGKPSNNTKSSAAATKRKAADDASPVTKKKTRFAKKAGTLSKPAGPNGPESEAEEPSPFDEEEEEERGATASSAMMKLIDSDGEEDDEDSADEEETAISKVPKIPKHQKPAKGHEEEGPGVVYVGRIPHGFYEHQMRAFFSQFGDINKLRLSRNKKTGASKHYAFIEFAEESTAEIVARTMDNYQMYERILKVKMVPQEKLHPDLWKGCNRRYKIVPWKKLAANKLNKPKTEEQWNKSVSKEAKRRGKLANKLKAMDYAFDMPALATPPKPVASIDTKVDEEGAAIRGEVHAVQAAPESRDAREQEEASEEIKEKESASTKDAEAPPPPPVKKGKKSRQKKSKA